MIEFSRIRNPTAHDRAERHGRRMASGAVIRPAHRFGIAPALSVKMLAGISRALSSSAIVALVIISTGCTAPTAEPIQLQLDQPLHLKADQTLRADQIALRTRLPEGAIIIESDHVILDLNGGTLNGAEPGADPDQLADFGVVVRRAKNVTIRNMRIRGFKVAIYAEDAPGLVIDNCDVSDNFRQRLGSTPFREHYSDWIFPHQNDENEWLRYGAGIYLQRCDGARVVSNRARRGQNGICLVSTRDAHVEANDMSFLSGWGIALWRSSRNMIVDNRFDFCVRGFSSGVYERGQDSAGILLFEQSSENIIAENSATHGGDGLFIYAGHETLKETGEGGCNRNLVYGNDFSYAVMHGIENTFTDQNAFVNNTLIGCTNGLWGGYSSRMTIAGNIIMNCENGIAIEHGRENSIEYNRISFAQNAVRIWWDQDPDLFKFRFCEKHGTASKLEAIRNNQILNCDVGVHATDTSDAQIVANSFAECRMPLLVDGDTPPPRFSENQVADGSVANQTIHPLHGAGNVMSAKAAIVGPSELVDNKAPNEVSTSSPEGHLPLSDDEVAALLAKTAAPEQRKKLGAWESNQSARATRSTAPVRGASVPAGRDRIIVGEWGPCDYEELDSRAEPRLLAQGGKAFIQLTTSHEPFALRATSGDVKITPASGVTPVLIEIAPKVPAGGAVPYTLRLALSSRLMREFSGVLVPMSWHCQFYAWPVELDPRTGDENWAKIIATPPIHEASTEQINFVWGSRGPIADGPRDRFAAVGTSTLNLIKGRWRIRVMSDDGVRVYVDNKRLIDNWTWHVPTEDTGEFETSSPGKHDFRIEYFELEGHAELRFILESISNEAANPAVEP